MQSILERLESQKNWKEFMKKTCRRNRVTVDIASYFTPLKMRSVYDKFQKIYQSDRNLDKACWLENQLKSFCWCLIAVSGLNEKLIENFDQSQWEELMNIFQDKDESILRYESIKLVNERIHKNRSWGIEETQLLQSIIREREFTNKWNEIARKLYHSSDMKFFRSGKQCRERWLNHLDPSKKKGDWDEAEDKLIVNYILKHGKKWSTISKELESHRTEHMVKNRFKTLLIRQKKLTPRISNENSLLREIGKRINEAQMGQSFPVQRQHSFQQAQMPSLEGMQKSLSEKLKEKSDSIQQKDNSASVSNSKNAHMQQNSNYPSTSTLGNQSLIKREQQKLHKNILLQRQDRPVQEQMLETPRENLFSSDPILSKLIEERPDRRVNTSSTPSVSTPNGMVSTHNNNNYEMHQVYSPFTLGYPSGLTPMLFSPSPSVPFFMNSSFSAFDNQNQNLFISQENSTSNHIPSGNPTSGNTGAQNGKQIFAETPFVPSTKHQLSQPSPFPMGFGNKKN